jgi:dipeptidyl aminopeptidase/acylaminoacyl peptidase
VLETVDEVKKHLNVDGNQGLPEDNPQVYRNISAIPFAGTLKKMPVYLIHGEADDVVPVKQSQALARLLEPGGASSNTSPCPTKNSTWK